MQEKYRYAIIPALLLIGALVFAACSPASPKTPTADPNAVLTQAAMTVAVQLTQSAALTPSPTVTNTPAPTNTTAPAATAEQATPPPAVTNTSAPAANNPAPTTGDGASFVEDVTVPDGTGAAPGIPFTKTWRIKNTGKTTWTVNYALVWVEGEKMGAPDSIPMPNEVRPGETVDLSVKLTAPDKAGSYQTFFRLRNEKGQYFRLDGTGDLWVKIAVGGPSPTPNLTATAQYTPPAPTETKKP